MSFRIVKVTPPLMFRCWLLTFLVEVGRACTLSLWQCDDIERELIWNEAVNWNFIVCACIAFRDRSYSECPLNADIICKLALKKQEIPHFPAWIDDVTCCCLILMKFIATRKELRSFIKTSTLNSVPSSSSSWLLTVRGGRILLHPKQENVTTR